MAPTTPKSKQVSGYFTAEEKDLIEKAAHADRRSASSFLRLVVIREAKRVLMAQEDEPMIPTIEPKEVA